MLLNTLSGLLKVLAHGLIIDAVFPAGPALLCARVFEIPINPGSHNLHQQFYNGDTQDP
jgi:hypothetical protein